MKYKQIVFDIDGTLLDTERAVLDSFQDTVKTLTGECIPAEKLAFCLGITGEDALRRLSREINSDATNSDAASSDGINFAGTNSRKMNSVGGLFIEDVPGALELWVEKLGAYNDRITVFEGIPRLLAALEKQEIKMGIVTSKTRDDFNKNFDQFGLRKYFSTVICADDTKEHKPTPAPLLKYMEVTGEEREGLLYVGDSVYDRECAKGAGVDFALAGWGSKGRVEQADYRLQSPLDLLKI